MLSENSDLIRIVVNSMKNDLSNFNEVNNCLALSTIANIAGREMAEALYLDVYRLLVSEAGGSPFVKKKAALCLLRMYRKTPDTMPVGDWAKSIIPLIGDSDLGVSSSVVTLVTAFAGEYPQEYSGAIQKTLDKLDGLTQSQSRSDYEYYKIPNPWLQVKCLRLLQCFPPSLFLPLSFSFSLRSFTSLSLPPSLPSSLSLFQLRTLPSWAPAGV